MSRAKAYAQLVRLPNLFTAAADSLAGWLIAARTFDQPGTWLPLVGASVAIYGGGVALNDWFDEPVDRLERPGRPLPSGRVPMAHAAAIGFGGLALGIGLAALSGSVAATIVAAALAACVFLYDVGLKKTVLGPELMGACRGLNLLLGISPIFAWGADADAGFVALIAGSYALFVAGITWISRWEVESGRRGGVIAGWTLQALGLAGLALALGILQWIMTAPPTPEFSASSGLGTPNLLLGIAGLGLIAAWTGRANLRAFREPAPGTLQRAVKSGVMSLVGIVASLTLAIAGPLPALAVAAFWPPALLLGRWIYST